MLEQSFFGRKEYLDILKKRIIGLKDGYRQNVTLLGDELCGKTQLVFKLLGDFYDNSFINVYLEVRPESFSDFAKRFIGVLLYNFLSPGNEPLKQDLDFLLKKSASYIPKTSIKIKDILASISKRKKTNMLSELFSLPELIHSETGKFCVIILDEFHNMERLGIKKIYKEWAQLLMLQKSTMYIITSSRQFKAKSILTKDLSLLFGNFEVLTVEPFDISTTEEYLKLRLSGLNIEKGIRDFIVHFTGGWPFYLELITGSLLKSGSKQLVDILEELLFDSQGLLNLRFMNHLRQFEDSAYSQDYINILHLIANGRNRIKDIAHTMRKPIKEVDSRINYLIECDLIVRSADLLKTCDRVFGFWLRFVYKEKLNSLTFDSSNQKQTFRNNIESMINDFLVNSKKPFGQRLTELLRLFDDEKILLEKKRLRLNHFREIKPLEFNNRSIREGVLCRSTDSLWVLAFKTGILTEEDIIYFAKECKKYRNKLERKIIISLNGIDANSRLRAMEEKIWTWDVDNFNELLDLFSKPRIVSQPEIVLANEVI